MLYHATWQDLYVSGLENSYFFLIGAIRNLFEKKKPIPGKIAIGGEKHG